ncbi:hypothetical protein IEQ34_006046 [Dendrobium chrysotoxum]|uniref:Uncharacterized protein n=1 Tax=Dendrobium chrysotoxum TaxID=161865 RepID=A0AAV7HD41_DENCH|nr:hypothetical protein IEQ34_006046 [Dendrobium chrysotoxum]
MSLNVAMVGSLRCVRASEIGLNVSGAGGEGVLAAETDGIKRAAKHGYEISGGNREDIGA